MSAGFRSIREIEQANVAAGQCWFSPSSLRWFASRVHGQVYGGRYFVSSECAPYGERRFTVREAIVSGDDCGHIETVGEFGQYASRSGAHAAAARLARAL
jgi:hypothetical protein